MNAEDEVGVEGPTTDDEQVRPSRAPRLGTAALATVAGVLVVVLVAALVVAATMEKKNRDHDALVRARAGAVAAANSFALAMDDVNGADFDAYIKKIDALLTTKARTQNAEGLSALKTVYQQGKVKGTGKVLMSGVGDADANSATVLVVHDETVSSTAGKVVHHYRWKVDMVKVGSRWLVDDFESTSEEASQ